MIIKSIAIETRPLRAAAFIKLDLPDVQWPPLELAQDQTGTLTLFGLGHAADAWRFELDHEPARMWAATATEHGPEFPAYTTIDLPDVTTTGPFEITYTDGLVQLERAVHLAGSPERLCAIFAHEDALPPWIITDG